DVIDEGDIRRGNATVNRLFGNETAILAGDLLLSRASVICSSLDPEINKVIAFATSQVCEGELAQLLQRDNFQLTEPEYIKIISQKTAALFSSCCKLGAVCSNASGDKVEALNEFGKNIGIAFQITDDLLDIIGNEKQTGKTAGRDADKNKLTLSLIHKLSSVNEKEKMSLILKIENSRQDRKVLAEILSNNGSLEYASKRAQHFVDLAIDSLAAVSDSPAKQALLAIANFVTNRVA
ncbi:MAG TPA: polyprenyl synthetase family protein, partial [Sedimentisphaerales bacterium]|nr:polyprenyl synthetase family protein [Sedimentisphaerales bacterium]